MEDRQWLGVKELADTVGVSRQTLIFYFSVSKNYVTVFNTSGSFYDHMVPNFYLTVCRIKIVDLSGSPKTHSDYC